MTQLEKLDVLIQKAIDNGFNPAFYADASEHIKYEYKNHKLIRFFNVQGPQNTILEISINALLINLRFRQALFGESREITVPTLRDLLIEGMYNEVH